MVFDKDRGQSVPTYEHVTNMATASSEQMRAWGADPVRVEPWDPNGPDGVKQVLNRALRCIEEEDPTWFQSTRHLHHRKCMNPLEDVHSSSAKLDGTAPQASAKGFSMKMVPTYATSAQTAGLLQVV